MTAIPSFVISFLKDKNYKNIIYDVVCFILAFILAKRHFLVFSFIALLPKPASLASSDRKDLSKKFIMIQNIVWKEKPQTIVC